MKRKAVIAMIGVMSMAVTSMPFTQAFAAENDTEAVVVAEAETEAPVQEEAAEDETVEAADVAEAAEEAAPAEAPEETEAAPAEKRKITLKDMEYREGAVDKKGWKNDFFMIGYRPEKGVTMDPESDLILEDYYEREGKDNKVATSEMVAFAGDDSYIQIMAEVNPVNEKNADILEDFMKTENFKANTVNGASRVGDVNFVTVDGKTDDGACLLAVSESKDGIVLAVKVKYADDKAKNLLLSGFVSIEEEEQTEAAAEETEAVEKAEEAPEAEEAATEAEEAVQADAETEAEESGLKSLKKNG